MARRTNRQSAVPASRLNDYQIFVVEARLQAKSWYDRLTGEKFYAINVDDLPVFPDEPPAGYLYIGKSDLSIYQQNNMPIEPIHASDARGFIEEYYLIRESLLPPIDEPEKPISPGPKGPIDIPSGVPKRRKPEPVPKRPILRQVLQVESDGTRVRFPVAKIPKGYGIVQDIDEPLPAGYRVDKNVIGRIRTERGVQLILAPGSFNSGLGDELYRNISEARGTYDVRTLNYAKRGGRIVEALGEGHEIYKGRPGKYAKYLRAIGKIFIKGGGRYKP